MSGAFEERLTGLFDFGNGGGGSGDDLLERVAREVGLYEGTAEATRTPIGVPSDYTAPPRRYNTTGMSPRAIEGGGEGSPGWNGRKQGWAPLYFDGDQYMPGSLDPGKIAELQADLAEIGLLKPGYRKNVWDAQSADAYAQLLAYANQNGLTRDQALVKYKAGEGEGEAEESPYGPLIVKEPNRKDVEMVMRDAYLNLTGVGGNPDAIRQATDAYIQAVRAPQEQQYMMERAAYETALEGGEPAGGTVVEAPSAEAFASDYVRQADPQGVATESGLGYIRSIMENINGWGA